MINLITADSYFELFPALTNLIKKSPKDIGEKNVIFCEAKVSLMIERFLCEQLGGTFNTEVYSFGKYLHKHKKLDKVLSAEGSAMAVKKILSKVGLKCFKASYRTLAPSLYNLIILLKSAKISPEVLADNSALSNGVLKNKLEDIYSIYNQYERFIKDNDFVDQSSLLDFLPDVIDSSEEIKEANVYLVGYSGFTAQARSIIERLMLRAKSVTAILTEGGNIQVFVNETANFIRQTALKLNLPLAEQKIDSDYTDEGKLFVDGLFSPLSLRNAKKLDSQKVSLFSALNGFNEAERVAEVIKSAVLSGECRYRDISVAVPDVDGYKEYIRSAFNLLEIPYYLDERKPADTHPLISLILSYVEVLRKNFQRNALVKFIKNPLFIADKNFGDAFENYLVKYNINYGRIKTPFTFEVDGGYTLEQFNAVREQILTVFERFDVYRLLSLLDVKDKIAGETEVLKQKGLIEESAVNEQIYDFTVGVLDQMRSILSGVDMTLNEFKQVFTSGVSAMKVSIIPQYNDAVFVGGFKETALAKAKKLFVMGLTASVPQIKQDVAILSDGDIDELEKVKVLIEPKIKVVNHRAKENLAMCLSAFSEHLYLSYPILEADGKKNVKSEVLTFVDKHLTTGDFPSANKYLTKKQGLKTFAKESSQFAQCLLDDFTLASNFFKAVGEEELNRFLDYSNKEMKIRLDRRGQLIGSEISPTTIEDYYKCPYRAFLSRTLRIKLRDEGRVDVLSVGNLMHEILSQFIVKMDDKTPTSQTFAQIKEQVLLRDEYKKFLEDDCTFATIERVLVECEGYCNKMAETLKDTSLNKTKTEVAFGSSKNCEYPAISLDNGRVTIKGKIDRVDEGDKYFRIIDYKTGTTDGTAKGLFAGVKLQLYLYALAVAGKYDGNKKPAGLYYLPVSNAYQKDGEEESPLAVGKTLNEKEALLAQDKNFFDNLSSQFIPAKIDDKGNIKNAVEQITLDSCLEYALNISNLAVERLKEGVIVKSPLDDACSYCPYKAICGDEDVHVRTLGSVDNETIEKSQRRGE
ncbi:MAG: exodeoxyribonuclease V subunit gamma [Clostridia bacterium]|nr:exodeoxyribonuclease V subunit gamma [Clostridia bacterium]